MDLTEAIQTKQIPFTLWSPSSLLNLHLLPLAQPVWVTEEVSLKYARTPNMCMSCNNP